MKLGELLKILGETAQELNVAKPFCCGGVARDKYMNRLDNISDLDVTNGEKTIDYLSQEFYLKLRKKYDITRKTMEDGHSSIFMGNLKLDFSSNFIVSNIDQYLSNLNIKNPTNLQKEMFSRDFTCNALLLTLDLKTLLDPTKRGMQDIKEKKIKTCLSPEITLTSNKNRVIRSIYLSCKLGFDIDQNIINYVAKNPQTVKISTEKSLIEKLNSAFEKDADKAAYLLDKMNLWNFIPITESMYPFYQKRIKNA